MAKWKCNVTHNVTQQIGTVMKAEEEREGVWTTSGRCCGPRVFRLVEEGSGSARYEDSTDG